MTGREELVRLTEAAIKGFMASGRELNYSGTSAQKFGEFCADIAVAALKSIDKEKS
jgi:hypothetical protein